MEQEKQLCSKTGEIRGGYHSGYFARNLAFWRAKRKLSLKEAAQKLGVASSTWSQWESSKRNPSIAFLPLLAIVLSIPHCSLVSPSLANCLQCQEKAGNPPRPDSHSVNSPGLPKGRNP